MVLLDADQTFFSLVHSPFCVFVPAVIFTLTVVATKNISSTLTRAQAITPDWQSSLLFISFLFLSIVILSATVCRGRGLPAGVIVRRDDMQPCAVRRCLTALQLFTLERRKATASYIYVEDEATIRAAYDTLSEGTKCAFEQKAEALRHDYALRSILEDTSTPAEESQFEPQEEDYTYV
ncbi:hypothetical protein TRVL_03103 [Trypanosoma vivax]|nr:hypothetical protein TRVL_03103 [Trypanosoma vivax]